REREGEREEERFLQCCVTLWHTEKSTPTPGDVHTAACNTHKHTHTHTCTLLGCITVFPFLKLKGSRTRTGRILTCTHTIDSKRVMQRWCVCVCVCVSVCVCVCLCVVCVGVVCVCVWVWCVCVRVWCV